MFREGIPSLDISYNVFRDGHSATKDKMLLTQKLNLEAILFRAGHKLSRSPIKSLAIQGEGIPSRRAVPQFTNQHSSTDCFRFHTRLAPDIGTGADPHSQQRPNDERRPLTIERVKYGSTLMTLRLLKRIPAPKYKKNLQIKYIQNGLVASQPWRF